MVYTNDFYMRFPAVLREKLMSGEIEFPDTTQFEYLPLRTYRAVAREKEDNHAVDYNDFKSYFELNQSPKKQPRGIRTDFRKDPHYYGVSSFIDRRIVEQKMKFPNPHKKMASGFVHKEGGPQDTKDRHVCWWLFENADISSFKLEE